MAIQHYKGDLGEFDYDDMEFRFETVPAIPCGFLTYIGSETDGRKIHIPDGIKSCERMFEYCEFLEIAPVIPNSVENCRNMFECCERLVSPPVIPNGVKDCYHMFYGCESLKYPFAIPSSVVDCSYMFCYCGSLELPPFIPDGVENCSNMFSSCTSLKTPPVIPDSVKCCGRMFNGCISLETPPVIPDGVKDCDEMFQCCCALKEPPVIPESVETVTKMFGSCFILVERRGEWNIQHRGKDQKQVLSEDLSQWLRHYRGDLGEFDYDEREFSCSDIGSYIDRDLCLHYIGFETDGSKIHIPQGIVDCSYMFDCCNFLETPPIIPTGVHDCHGMFSSCTFLNASPAIPDSVKDCSYMFLGCKALESVPVIPNSVINCDDMFYGSGKIEAWGEWNIEHRGRDYMREIVMPRKCVEIVQRSTAMYKRHKQIAVKRATDKKDVEVETEAIIDDFVESNTTQQVKIEAKENDITMEV